MIVVGTDRRLTDFYGTSEDVNRQASWDLLRRVKGFQNLPWFIAGDFNEIMYSFENKGGRLQNERIMARF